MIIFDTVTKQFTPDAAAISQVSFTINPGEFVVVTGKSGAGKTTLMRLLTKEYTPTEGSIQFEDTDLSTIPYSKVHLLRRRIGVVFQDYRLLPELNVWENIALPLSIVGQPDHEIEERVTDLLRLINLPEKADLFPSQLSGGEAQRVSIARALANGPSVVFADEPTGNLDGETSLLIGKLLKKINELGTTVLFATHDPAILEYLKKERHLHMEGGKLVKDTQNNKVANKDAKTAESKKATPTKVTEKKVDDKIDKKTEVEQDVKPDDKPTNKTSESVGFWDKLFGKKKASDDGKHHTDHTLHLEDQEHEE